MQMLGRATITILALLTGAVQAAERYFDIPEQALGEALVKFSEQADTLIMAPQELVKGKSSAEVKGMMSVKDALDKLLQGSGLKAAEGAKGGITILQAGTRENSGERDIDIAAMRLAQAQQSEGNAEPSTAKGGSQLEEIVVTAQRRAQRLSDVPISISVLTADDIDRRGLVSAEDYLRGIPGTNQVSDRRGQSIVIRGIETSPLLQNSQSGATVATYFGETPTTNSAGLAGNTAIDLKLVDIERVEVLRGPQGTAFGNSALGGAVRTIPVAPKLDRLEGKVGLGYSATSGTGGDNYNVQAIGNLPLVKDRLALRATAYKYEESGYYRSTAGSDLAFQAAVQAFGAQAFATDEEEVGSASFMGGRISALFAPTDNLRFTVSYLHQETEQDGFGGQNAGHYAQNMLEVAPEHVARGERRGVLDFDIDIANVVAEYEFGRANLLATYSYTSAGNLVAQTFGTFVPGLGLPASLKGNGDHRAHVGEIRFATQFDGPLNFLGGLYTEDLEDEVSYTYYWIGDPATNFLAPGARQIGAYPETRAVKQDAAYGEVSWEFLEGLTLTGGARVYEYTRDVETHASGPLYGAAGIHQNLQVKASDHRLRANLSYEPAENVLLYAGWSEGFRLGLPQSGAPAGLCDPDGDGVIDGTNITIQSTRSTRSDSIENYEVGTKISLLDRRLSIDADVFHMEWTDVPIRVPLPTTICGWPYIANAGVAHSDGIELQARLQLTEAFQANIGGSYLRARLAEDAPALGARSGARLPGSPKVNANIGLEYAFRLAGYAPSVRADAIYVGPFYGNLLASPNTQSADYVKVDVSARVTVRDLNVDFVVRNLTNEDAWTFRGIADLGTNFGYRLQPRTVGLQFGYRF